jgi:hypothetical protein
MPTLNESIVEDAALEWFGKEMGFGPTLTPAFCVRLFAFAFE